MNPNQCRIALRPRSVLEVFDLSWRLIRARWWTFGVLAALALLPVALVLTGICWFLDGHPALIVLPVLLGPFVRAPFTMAAGRLLFAEEIPAGTVLGQTFRQLPAVIAHALVYVMGNALLCGLMLPVSQGVLLYQAETALLERVSVQRGIQRSIRLASGHFGIALAGAVATWFLLAWFAVMGEYAGQALVGFVFQLGEPFGHLAEDRITPYVLAGMLIAQPVIAIYRLLLYVDVRTRIEGWDLQVGFLAVSDA